MTATFQTAYGSSQVRLSYVREDDLTAGFPAEQPILNDSRKVAEFFRSVVATRSEHDSECECFVSLSLDKKNRLKGWHVVSKGIQDAALAHPREVFRAAIIAGAAVVVCIHNHPSGDPSPSAADVQLTRKLREGGETLGISVLDHVIVGRQTADPMGKGFYSFREAGLL